MVYNMQLRYINVSTVQVENMHKNWSLKSVTFQIFLQDIPLDLPKRYALHDTNSVEH